MPQNYSSVTMRDVAKAAGVSLMTVTRAYRPEALVAEKTRKRVFKIAKRLGYWPNLNAQALRGGKSMSVGILLSNPVSNSISRGISEGLMRKGYVTYVADSLGDEKIVESCLRDFLSRNVDSVILAWKSNFCQNPEIEKMLARLKSVILIATEEVSDEEISRMPYDVLQFSCKNAYCEVVQHLIFAGKKKIVFLGRDNYDYYSAVKSALDTNNCLSNDWHWDTSAYPGKPHWENFLDACKDKLDAGIKPDAILTSGDFIAARIIACLKEYDLKVPEDIAVIGLGNSCWGTLCTTALATIDLLEDKMTRQIMSVLLKILDGAKGKAEYAVIPAKFICRKSAG